MCIGKNFAVHNFEFALTRLSIAYEHIAYLLTVPIYTLHTFKYMAMSGYSTAHLIMPYSGTFFLLQSL